MAITQVFGFAHAHDAMLTRSELELFLEGSELVGRFQVRPPLLSHEALAPHAGV